MTLKEVGIVIGKKLQTKRRPIKSSPIIIFFDTTEIKNRRMLISSYGEGKTVGKAKADYCKKIRGQIIVADAMEKSVRKEIQLPPRITVK